MRIGRLFRRWGLLGMAVAAVWIAARIDQGLKRAPHLGFCPPQSQWTAVCEDGPAFWTQLKEQSPVNHSLPHLSAWMERVEAGVWEATGVRPTLSRWRFWLGPQSLASGYDGVWGVCVRPGIAMRCLLWFREWRSSETREDVPRYGRFFYAWRDGFLLASPSAEYVRAALTAAPVSLAAPRSAKALKAVFRWPGRRVLTMQKAECTLWAEPGLYVEGKAMAEMAFSGGGMLTLPDAWDTRPALSVTGISPGEVRVFLTWCVEVLGGLPRASSLMEAGFPALPSVVAQLWHAIEQAGAGETSVYLSKVDAGYVPPIPVFGMAVVAQASPPMEEVLGPLLGEEAFPYAWDGRDGWRMPLWGAAFAPCFAEDGARWLVTSQEPGMADLAARLGPGQRLDADLALRVDWEAMAGAATETLRFMTANEMAMEMNGEDYRRDWRPVLEALAEWGECRVNARAWGGWIQFEGYLARSGEGRS